MTTWLLCDYGEVLSLPQPAATVAAMCEVADMGTDHFLRAYWEHRPGYDRGDLAAAEYWSAVLGPRPDDVVARLVELDVEGWLGVDEQSVTAAVGCGARLAVLSNAPVEVAAAIDRLPALAPFEPRLFSCHLRRVKPEPAAFSLTLERLGASPAEVVFVDDRAANVEAATAAGLRAVRYSGLSSWASVRALVSPAARE